MTYTIQIPGELARCYPVQPAKSRMWTHFKQHRMHWLVALESSFGTTPLLQGELDLHLDIYYTREPREIESLKKFVQALAFDILFDSTVEINSFTIQKYEVKKDPYTIFTIKES